MGVTTRGATAPVKPSEVRPLERFTIRSVAGLLAVVGAGTGFGLLLLLVGRLRPMVAEPVATAPGNSFPSGHALGSIVAYGALLLVFLPIIPRRFRGATIAATVALVVAI